MVIFSKFMSVAALVISLGTITLPSPSNAQQPSKVPTNLNLNKILYEKFCSSCHGVDLKGTQKGPTFLHRVYHPGHHRDGAFFLAAKRGVRAHHWKFGNMPPVPEATADMVASIVKYIRHMQKQAGIF